MFTSVKKKKGLLWGHECFTKIACIYSSGDCSSVIFVFVSYFQQLKDVFGEDSDAELEKALEMSRQDLENGTEVSFIAKLFLKVALQILGRKFKKNTKQSSLHSQSLLIFIHRTLVVKRHPITREIKDLLWPRLTPTRNTVYFYLSSSFIYTLKIHR